MIEQQIQLQADQLWNDMVVQRIASDAVGEEDEPGRVADAYFPEESTDD